MITAALALLTIAGCVSPRPRRAPVQVGVTVHLEGWAVDDEDTFRLYVSLLRERAALFESYGARLTLESKEMTDGIALWGDNVLLELQGRGHAVGIHADLGGQLQASTESLTADMRALRQKSRDLGLDVRHVSGICSHADWVTAAIDAGFEFTSSVVAYCLRSLPEEDRPAKYADCLAPSDCHDTLPRSVVGRSTPRRVRDGASWLTPDPAGAFVLMPAQGSIACLAELGGGEVSPTGCAFDAADVETWRRGLERAIELSEPGAVLDYHVSWSFGEALDPETLTLWLETMDTYRRGGQIAWRTLPEVHDLFVAQERRRARDTPAK